MANILIDGLPNQIDGISINTDFRVCILFELLMQDCELTDSEKLCLAINLFYSDEVVDYQKALKNIVWFYSCGKESKSNGKNQKVIYSFEHDSEYIFSAFLSQYNLDLNSIKYLHWWKFRALFNGLNEDHLFNKIMSYRAIDLSKIKDKEQRKYYRDLKIKYRLPDTRSKRDKEREFANALG
jgi:hypothetical protein